jgi:CRISPR/Cas system CMR-associated protein Cmr5 small subunit
MKKKKDQIIDANHFSSFLMEKNDVNTNHLSSFLMKKNDVTCGNATGET